MVRHHAAAALSFGAPQTQPEAPPDRGPAEVEKPVGDRRSVERQRVLRKGSILFIGSDAAIDCVILDISPKGARLRPIDVPSCPNLFDLKCPDRTEKRCIVVWRQDNQIGVKFE